MLNFNRSKSTITLFVTVLCFLLAENFTLVSGFQNQVSFKVDPQLLKIHSLPNNSRMIVMADEKGKICKFVSNEVLIASPNVKQLNSFLSTYNGVVVATNAVPDPPKNSKIQINPADKIPTLYTVKVDITKAPPSNLDDNALKIGLKGAYILSSDIGVKLLSIIFEATVQGLKVSPNYIGETTEVLFSTEEQYDTTSARYENAMNWDEYSTIGSKSFVKTAWQFVAARPPSRSVKVAIIDNGFSLDERGRTYNYPPITPLQYDFVEGDYFAGGAGPGGSWHGHYCASVATAKINDRFGAAGTGGLATYPVLLKADNSAGQTAAAIRCAVSWGAGVISMSFTFKDVNFFTHIGFETNLYPALRNARDNNVITVSSAGNDNKVADGNPCQAAENAICVGAINPTDNLKTSYSNFGSTVKIWAPGTVRTDPLLGYGSLDPFNGTSASAPFIAGIAAMMKAYNPSLSSASALRILQETAWRDSPDPNVTHYVNAHEAVRKVAGENFPIDTYWENNDTRELSRALRFNGLTSSFETTIRDPRDIDWYSFTTDDYTDITVKLEFVEEMGSLQFQVFRDIDSASIRLDLPRRIPNGLEYRTIAGRVALPGGYRVMVSGIRSNIYRLTVIKAPVREVPRDIALPPDRFENNNTIASASNLVAVILRDRSDAFRVSIHEDADTDYYFIDPPSIMPTLRRFLSRSFDIQSSDRPVTVTVFNSDGVEIISDTRSVPVDFDQRYIVKVEGVRGRYTFSLRTVNSIPRIRR